MKVSLKYLFFTFLKIGAISWGGFMALISVVQNNLVERDKVIEDEEILDGTSLASILPGPVAFNVVAYLGYRLRGIKGALVSMVAILLPSFILILALTYFYFEYGDLLVLSNFFLGVLPAVSAIIISVAFNMSKKHIKDIWQIIICLIAGVTLIFAKSFFTTLFIMTLGSLLGYILYKNSIKSNEKQSMKKLRLNWEKFMLFIISIALFLLLIWILPSVVNGSISEKIKLQRDILFTFSGMSITLFGGGYVIIPTIQTIIVDSLHWLNNKEFADAIAMGQITPGPIFISATFIGYKVGGIWGAITATLAIFLPPGFLIIFTSRFLGYIKQSHIVKALFKGLRPAIIGMIFAASYTITKGIAINWITEVIFIGVLIASLKFKINVVYLIPVSGILGIIIYNYV